MEKRGKEHGSNHLFSVPIFSKFNHPINQISANLFTHSYLLLLKNRSGNLTWKLSLFPLISPQQASFSFFNLKGWKESIYSARRRPLLQYAGALITSPWSVMESEPSIARPPTSPTRIGPKLPAPLNHVLIQSSSSIKTVGKALGPKEISLHHLVHLDISWTILPFTRMCYRPILTQSLHFFPWTMRRKPGPLHSSLLRLLHPMTRSFFSHIWALSFILF